MQAFFEAHPQLAERFPGGIIQFAEMAGQLPEEALEDMMIAEVGFGPGDGQGQGEMNMPGMFGMEDDPGVGFANAGLVPHVERFPNGREDDFVDEEDETEEDEEDMEVRCVVVYLYVAFCS